jgi:hypothetical protein
LAELHTAPSAWTRWPAHPPVSVFKRAGPAPDSRGDARAKASHATSPGKFARAAKHNDPMAPAKPAPHLERNRFDLQQAVSKIVFANSILLFARQRILIQIYRFLL